MLQYILISIPNFCVLALFSLALLGVVREISFKKFQLFILFPAFFLNFHYFFRNEGLGNIPYMLALITNVFITYVGLVVIGYIFLGRHNTRRRISLISSAITFCVYTILTYISTILLGMFGVQTEVIATYIVPQAIITHTTVHIPMILLIYLLDEKGLYFKE